MDRSRVAELHFITTLDNLHSICEHGVLCRKLAARIPHTSIADEEIQDRRVGKKVPGGADLHDYANLYFDARNAMMYRRRDEREDLVVVRVKHEVMDITGAVIADGNAASGPTRFYPSPDGLQLLDEARVFAQSWTSNDPWDYWERKRQRQAEVLVPRRVPVSYLLGCYVRNNEMLQPCLRLAQGLDVQVGRRVFFDA